MKRIGTITFNRHELFEVDKIPSLAYEALLSVFSPYRTTENFMEDTVSITGYCGAFDELGFHEVVPDYSVEFTRINDLLLVTNIKRK